MPSGQWSCCQVNYTHDASGNLTQLGTTRLTYGDTGHLRTANSGATEYARYTYNHQRLRTRRVAGGSTTLYHFDINDRIIAETTPGGTLLRAFLYTDDAPIAQITNTGAESLLYLHPDHLGTPRLATDTTRTVRWRLARTFFGDTADEDPDRDRLRTPIPLRQAGQYEDPVTGLVYNHRRWLWKEQDRYLTPDPMGVTEHVQRWKARLGSKRGTMPLELNPYAYVANNPLRWIDPTGESAIVVPRPIPFPGVIPRPIPAPIDPVLPVPPGTIPKDDTQSYCTRLYVRCVQENWGGDWSCGQCHFFCTGTNQEWPFEHCSPDLRACRP